MSSPARSRHHVLIDARKAFDGGIGRHVREIVRLLPAAMPGWRLSLLIDVDASDRFRAAGLGEPAFEHVEVRAKKYGLAERRALRHAARVVRPDLFHAPHYVLPSSMPCPSIVTIHDVIHLKRPRTPLHRAYARWAMRAACREARRVVTVSEASAADLRQLVGVDPRRLRVIPNGAWIAEPPATAVTSSEYVLYLGSLKPHKNVSTLIEAFARTCAPLELWLAGQWQREERYRRDLVARVTAAGLDRRVRFLGGFPETSLDRLLFGARMLVAPSWEEGFGLPALEALAHGTAVIASRRGAHPEVLGDAAVLVDGSDPSELATAIDTVAARNPLEQARWAEAGRARARLFDWTTAARATAAVYAEVLKGLRCRSFDTPHG